jgi:hypothetical protein
VQKHTQHISNQFSEHKASWANLMQGQLAANWVILFVLNLRHSPTWVLSLIQEVNMCEKCFLLSHMCSFVTHLQKSMYNKKMSPKVLPKKKIPHQWCHVKEQCTKYWKNIKSGQTENMQICSWIMYGLH